MKDQRITNRTVQLNLKVKKKFKQKLKAIADQEKSLLTEIVEKAVDLYEQKRQRQLRYQQQKSKPAFLVAHPQTNFECDNCYRKFKGATAYTFASNWKELDQPKPYTYCRRCVFK
jgi:hypothetical protein